MSKNNRREEFIERPLPANLDAERIALGSAMIEPQFISLMLAETTPDDFSTTLHEQTRTAIERLFKRGAKVDPITIHEEFKKFSNDGGAFKASDVAALSEGFPVKYFTAATLREHYAILREKSTLRAIMKQANVILQTAWAEDTESASIIATGSHFFNSFRHAKAIRSTRSIKDVAASVRNTFDGWKEGTKGASFSTGIPELDNMLRLRGIAKSELTYIAARPSLGKTALTLQMLTHFSRLGVPCLFVSLEMQPERLVMRMLPKLTGVANKSINPRTIKHDDEASAKLYDALTSVEDLPIHFESGAFDIQEAIAIVEHYCDEFGVQVAAFDYIQLMQANNLTQVGRNRSKRALETRNAELDYISRELKNLAVRRDIAVIVDAQLNREVEKEGRRPQKSDLRDSGGLEAAADVLVFIYDPNAKKNAKLNANEMPATVDVKLYCAKQRDGGVDWQIDVAFERDNQFFMSDRMYEQEGRSRFEHLDSHINRVEYTDENIPEEFKLA